jgi:hypothetical protein
LGKSVELLGILFLFMARDHRNYDNTPNLLCNLLKRKETVNCTWDASGALPKRPVAGFPPFRDGNLSRRAVS